MLVVGVTTGEPLEYKYVLAPVGTIVNDRPEQIVPEFTVIVGVIFTVTELTTEPIHPDELALVIV